MITTGVAISVWIQYSLEASLLAALMYALAWNITGGTRGQNLRLARRWHVVGWLATCLGAGGIRVATALLFGGDVMVPPVPIIRETTSPVR